MVHWDHYEIRSKFLGDFSLPLQGWVYFFCLNCDILLVLLFLPNKVSKNILTCLAGICRGYICRVIKLDPLHTYYYTYLSLWFLPKTVCKMKPSPPAAQVNRDVAEYKNKSKNSVKILQIPFSFWLPNPPHGGNKRIILLSIAQKFPCLLMFYDQAMLYAEK